jgi:hypothetical protein
MEAIGIHPERLGLHWASAAEATLYVELITTFTKKIEALGPVGSQAGLSPEELQNRLAAAREAAMNVKLRTRLAQMTKELRELQDYSEEVLAARLAEKVEPALVKVLGHIGGGGQGSKTPAP